MTDQEIFDKVVTHLRQQKVRATQWPGSITCYYRTSQGLKCAVGCLIPDELYNPSFEGCSVGKAWSQRGLDVVLRNIGIDDSQVEFLRDLQSIHDTDIANWEDDLEELAVNYHLKYTEPTHG